MLYITPFLEVLGGLCCAAMQSKERIHMLLELLSAKFAYFRNQIQIFHCPNCPMK